MQMPPVRYSTGWTKEKPSGRARALGGFRIDDSVKNEGLRPLILASQSQLSEQRVFVPEDVEDEGSLLLQVGLTEDVGQIFERLGFVAMHRDQNVARLDAFFSGRALWTHPDDF
jgi:hypothetical protein